ncbi:MAG: hypothetical protein ACJA08_001086 [Cyclobacteriaceae bacterium]|jgi:hypothetical protein
MKSKYLAALSLTVLLGSVVFFTSCSDDESFNDPEISLSSTATTAAPGQEVTVTVTAIIDATFESIVVTKLWDGNSEGTETITTLTSDTFTYSYTVLGEDAEHILSFNFLITDSEGKSASVDWIITVELTPGQLLLKYNWRLSAEIRQKTNTDDINSAYSDDVYSFNEDGTYAKNNADTKDDFNDSWYNYCFYDLNETTLRLLMSRTGAFGEDNVDTLNITTISDSQLIADVTYYGLDALNTGNETTPYEAVEEFEKQFSAVAKTASFDPYGSGTEDDAGPAGMDCIPQTFDN